MFNVNLMQADTPDEIVVPLGEKANVLGDIPTITIKITNDARERQSLIFQRRWLRTTRNDDGEDERHPDYVGYAKDMAFCVIDSSGIFFDDDGPVKHTRNHLLNAIKLSPFFAMAIAGVIQGQFVENDQFLKSQETDDEKNS